MDANYQKVIDKLDAEAEKSKNPAFREIEALLREVCSGSSDTCAAVLHDDKTLEGAYKALFDFAKSHQESGCCVVPPEKASSIILTYYGVTAPVPPFFERAESQTSGTAQTADSRSDTPPDKPDSSGQTGSVKSGGSGRAVSSDEVISLFDMI